MFRNQSIHSSYVSVVMLFIVFFGSGDEASASIRKPMNSCVQSLPIDLNGVVLGELMKLDDGIIFYFDVPTAGLLSMDVAMESPGEAFPELELLGRDCDPLGVDRAVATIERTDSRQLIAFAEPGGYYLRVTAGDSRLIPGAFELTTSFAVTEVVETVHYLGLALDHKAVAIRQATFYSLFATKNEPEEVDPDPDKSRHVEPILTLLTARLAAFGKNEPEEVDPDPDKSVRRTIPSAQLVLFPQRRDLLAKNEPEEVDPDPDKSSRLVSQAFDGLLMIGESLAGDRLSRRSSVSFSVNDVEPSASERPAALRGWLAEVLQAEMVWADLFTPGTRDDRLQLLEYEPDPVD